MWPCLLLCQKMLPLSGCDPWNSEDLQHCSSQCFPLHNERHRAHGILYSQGRRVMCCFFAFARGKLKSRVSFMGFDIFVSLQGTMIIQNLNSVLREEGQWKFPCEFNPENFLNEKGEFVKPEAFIPFSAGKLACLMVEVTSLYCRLDQLISVSQVLGCVSERAWLVWSSSSS